MPSTFTTSLRLTLPATGENAGTWGSLVNTGITSLVDTSIAGTASITIAGTDYTLTSTNGAADEARAMIIAASGTPGAARNVICPTASKIYIFRNNTTGGFAMTLKTSGGSGIAVPAGQSRLLYCNGTNVVEALNAFSSLSLGTALGVASGGTGAATLTANNVLLGNGTSALQVVAPGATNNVLYSNGTTWLSGPLPSSSAVSSFSAGTTGFTPSTATTGAITLAGTLAAANGGTGLTTPGSTGNVLTSNGSAWVSSPAAGTPTLNIVTGTTQAATANNHYVLTNVAATTVTLPATPTAGDLVWVTVGNGLTTNVVARNGNRIQSLLEDLTLNAAYAAVQMRYINSTIGWTFV